MHVLHEDDTGYGRHHRRDQQALVMADNAVEVRPDPEQQYVRRHGTCAGPRLSPHGWSGAYEHAGASQEHRRKRASDTLRAKIPFYTIDTLVNALDWYATCDYEDGYGPGDCPRRWRTTRAPGRHPGAAGSRTVGWTEILSARWSPDTAKTFADLCGRGLMANKMREIISAQAADRAHIGALEMAGRAVLAQTVNGRPIAGAECMRVGDGVRSIPRTCCRPPQRRYS